MDVDNIGGMKMKLMTANETVATFFAGTESYQTILNMARSKQIPCAKIGKRIFFDKDVLEQFFAQKMAESIQIEVPKSKNGIQRID